MVSTGRALIKQWLYSKKVNKTCIIDTFAYKTIEFNDSKIKYWDNSSYVKIFIVNIQSCIKDTVLLQFYGYALKLPF